MRFGQAEIARRFPHLLVPAFATMTRFVARVRLEEPVCQMRERGAFDGFFASPRRKSGTRTSRIRAPNPSTIAMIVNARVTGSTTRSCSRNFACA